MKKLMNICLTAVLLISFSSCVDDDFDFGEITAPTNLTVTTEVVGVTAEMPDGDGSGLVRFNASADNAMTYKFIYGDGFTEVSYDGTTVHPFTSASGVNDYTVTIIASGTGGASSNITTTVTVFSDFNDPETKQLLTGGSTKTWYIAASQPAHLGVGPASGENFTFPSYYAATPFEKAGSPVSSCFYNDEMTFTLQGDDIIYNYDNMGQTFFNAAYGAQFGGSGSEDQCLNYTPSGPMRVSLSPSTSGMPEAETTGTVINITDGGFLSYYIGASSYEILEITPNYMHVRAIMGSEPSLAWYLKLTTAQGSEEPEEFESIYDDLLWEQDFNTAGALNPDIWNYEIGTGSNGWGNNELQYYTDDNAEIVDGNLVITAKAEPTNGSAYSSSRITTEDNFEFKYGRVEVRAKLPEGVGTWAAIWMLGSNFAEVGWPASGEIDIMEFVGRDPNTILGTLHYPGRSGGNADGGEIEIEDPSSEFHIYTMEWTPERIVFLVDGEVFHTYANSPTSPFNQEFFLILNIAMGGNLGGNVDPNFDESSMLVDYIRVYQ